MPSRRLRVRAVTNLDPLGLGLAIAEGRAGGDLPAHLKWTREERPFAVANEYICAELAHFLGLPIPPFAITHSDQLKGEPIFATLDINFDGRHFSPVDPACCTQHLEELCAGVLAFDVWIANSDRHDENVVVNNDLTPTELYLYDHDVALLGYFAGDGEKRLREMKNRLAISGSGPTGGNRHVFLDEIKSNQHFGTWCDRIHTVPQTFIDRICQKARQYGLSQSEADAAATFLGERRWDLRGILNRHRDQFSGISQWRLL